MLSGSKPLSSESLKFAVESYQKIKQAEEVARFRELSFSSTANISCKRPVNTERTPDVEFCRNRLDKNLWAVYEHGKFVCSFTEDLLKSLQRTCLV